MKPSPLIITLSLLLTMQYPIYSQCGTSNENTSPFNEAMNLEGGVDLYSGNVSFPYKLYTLNGRNNTSVDITLKYSSHVGTNVKASNIVAPTGWVGLGWALNYGSIICESNNTMKSEDDIFWWISHDGVQKRIYVTDQRCYIDGNITWKVEPVKEYESTKNLHVITGWVLTSPDGKQYRYGDFDRSAVFANNITSNNHATRYEFCWHETKYVGQGFEGTPYYYPYQWDLKSINDIYGNSSEFFYEQVLEGVTSYANGVNEQGIRDTAISRWSSGIKYTKASYLKEIRMPGSTATGHRAVFEREDKYYNVTDKIMEYMDPYQHEPEDIDGDGICEGDGFMERYETQRLKTIKVYNANNELIGKTVLQYEISKGAGNFAKSYLSQIIQTNGKDGNANLIDRVQFAYNNDSTCYDAGDGALVEARYLNGKRVEYTYKAQDARLMGNIATTVVIPDPKNKIFTGQTSSGEIYYGYFRKNTSAVPISNEIKIYTWDGASWGEQSWVSGLIVDKDARVAAAGDVVIIYSYGADSEKKVEVLTWDGGFWNAPDTHTVTHDIYEGKVGNDYFVVLGNKSTNLKNSFITVFTMPNKGMHKFDWINQSFAGNHFDVDTKNYLMLGHNSFSCGSTETMDVTSFFEWSGDNWKKYSNDTLVFVQDPPVPAVIGNYSIIGTRDHNGLRTDKTIYKFSGINWKKQQNAEWSATKGDRKITSFHAGKDLVGTVDYYYTDPIFRLFRWNGSQWVNAENVDGISGYEQSWQRQIVDNWGGTALITVQKEDYNYGHMHVHTWDILQKKFEHKLMLNSIFLGDATLNTSIGNSFFTMYATENENYLKYLKTYVYDGENLKPVQLLPEESTIGAIFTAGDMTLIYANSQFKSFFKCKDTIKQSSDSCTYSCVDEKIVYDGINESPLVYKYTFESSTAIYDTRFGTAKHNKVTVAQPAENGKTVYYFFNATKNGGQDSVLFTKGYGVTDTYRYLDGVKYKAEIYNKLNKVLNCEIYSYESLMPVDTGVQLPIIEHRLKKVKSTNLGVSKETEYSYQSLLTNLPGVTYNGKPEVINEWVAGDGPYRTEIITEIKYAFDKYPGLQNSYMITQPCQVMVTNCEAGECYSSSSTATTWSDTLGCAAWVPHKTFIWKVDLDENSKPGTFCGYFNFENIESNKAYNWVYTKTNTRYNKHGLLIEQSSPGQNGKEVFSTIVLRNDQSLPAASITNASFLESSAFTCDYDLDETDSRGVRYFDLENGWEKGIGNESGLPDPQVKVCEEAKHFGQKGVLVKNSYGPTRNYKLEKGKNYILTAYVNFQICGSGKGLDVKKMMGVDYRKKRADSGEWPLVLAGAADGSTPLACNGVRTNLKETRTNGLRLWECIQMTIPASTDISDAQWNDGYQYARVWVGCPNGSGPANSSTILFVDNIRFYPDDALVTTTYYDQKWFQPIISVDANVNPGQKTVYDDFGRVKKIIKFEPCYSKVTLIKEMEYFLKDEASGSPVDVSQNLTVKPNTEYLVKGAKPVELSLSTVFKPGDKIKVTGTENCWIIKQRAGQYITGSGLTKKSYTNWRQLEPGNTEIPSFYLAVSSDCQKIWWPLCGGAIRHSNNGGVTWSVQADVRDWMSIGCSADGQHVAAVAYNDQIYISHNSGVTWTARASNKAWSAVICSNDGNKIVATAHNDHIYISNDGGESWSAYGPQKRWWRGALTGSTDLVNLYVAEYDGAIYSSKDGGITWTQCSNDLPYISLKCSDNGKYVSATALSELNLSNDDGNTWERQFIHGTTWGDGTWGHWNSHAISADGTIIVMPDYDNDSTRGYTGMVYASFDRGKTWESYANTAGQGWFSIALSLDGTKLVAAHVKGNIMAADLTIAPVPSTTPGPTGSLSGKQGSTVELEYLGSGQFRVNSFTGEIDAR